MGNAIQTWKDLEDDEVYKSILKQSLEQAIADGSLDKELLPALQTFNDLPGAVTIQSCCGHPDRDIYFAFIDLSLSSYLWRWSEINTEFLLEDSPVAALEFHYETSEEGVQQVLRIRSHGGTFGEAAVAGFLTIAERMKWAHQYDNVD